MILSSPIRAQIDQIFANAHDTSKRDITLYKDSEENVTAFTSQYNSIYNTAGNTPLSIVSTTVSGVFGARILYIKNSEDFIRDQGISSQFKLSLPEGSVRIKVDKSGFNFLRDAKRVDLDGNRYSIITDSSAKPIGPFTPQYYTFYLAPIDENE